jgi:NADPH:quinone reductase-like Zn-dependent oxidoreductase
VALRRRVPIEPGQSVLVLGATGNAGTMAVQVAKRLGAGRVVGAGRDVTRLNALIPLGADDVVQITDDSEETARMLGEATAEVDIVIDSGPNQTSRTNELCSCHRASGSEIEQ